MNNLTQGEYANESWRQEQKSKRYQYWSALSAARQEYYKDVDGNISMTRPTMHYWMEQKYGIKMGLDGEGNYTQEYEVVEPKRFMLFQIKYFK